MRKTLVLLLMLVMLASDALAAVCVRMPDGAALLDDAGGEILPPGVYEDIVDIGGCYAGMQGGAYALLDAAGNALTGFVYSRMRVEQGMILAQRDGFWGILNPDGTRLSDFAYSWLEPAGASACWALRGEINDNESDELLLIDAMGFESPTGIYVRRFSRDASEGLLALQPADSLYFGYCDARGDMVIPAAYDYAGAFEGGAAIVVRAGRYGLIDAGGAFRIPAAYDFMERSGGLIAAKDADGVYVFDLHGSLIAAHADASCEIALVGEGYMLLDGASVQIYGADGTLRHTLPGDTSVSEGLDGRLIFSDGAWGEYCVWLEGTQARYQHLTPLGYAGGRALYACMQVNTARYMNELLGEIQLSADMDSARWGIVDSEGTPVLECIYDSVEIAGDGLLVCLEGAWQMIDLQGNVLWEAPMQAEESSSASDS